MRGDSSDECGGVGYVEVRELMFFGGRGGGRVCAAGGRLWGNFVVDAAWRSIYSKP